MLISLLISDYLFSLSCSLGCSGAVECLCIKEELCCTPSTPVMPCIIGAAEGFICKIGAPCCSCGVKVPTICAKGNSKCFCLTNQLALPPDADTPLMIAVYGLMCFPIQGCCVKFSEAVPAANESSKGQKMADTA